MSHRRLLGLLVGVALLSGCGGSSGTGNGGGGTPTVTPTPGSDRPGNAGISAQYTGTYSETIANNAINTAPVTQTTTATVTTNIASTVNGAGNTVFTANESDAGALQTVTDTAVATVAYQAVAGGATDVRALSNVVTDSGGVTYSTTYGAGNGLLTVLPETTGAFGPNNAQESYLETDPGTQSLNSSNQVQSVSIDREVNADGSYTQNMGSLTEDSTVVNNVATEAPTFSGALNINNLPQIRTYTFMTPAAGNVTYSYYNGFSMTTSNTTVPQWWPTSLATPSVETDSITTGAALDPSCHPAAAYAGSANKVTQTVTIADVVLGTLETRTTTAYDQPGPGTVCTVISDTIGTFYDYSYSEGDYRLFPADSATVPVEQITIAETVALQTTNAASVARSTQSLRPGSILPRTLLVAHVEHMLHQEAERRLHGLRLRGSVK